MPVFVVEASLGSIEVEVEAENSDEALERAEDRLPDAALLELDGAARSVRRVDE